MKKHFFCGLVLMLVFNFGCKSERKDSDPYAPKESLVSPADLRDGYQTAKLYCIACHSPLNHETTGVAPNLKAIKMAYMADDPTEEEFTSRMRSFLSDPAAEKSKMPKAVAQYGLMPKMNLSAEEYGQLALLLYRTDLEDPDWFSALGEKMEQAVSPDTTTVIDYQQRGLELAMATKAVLGKNLLTAISQRGTAGALEFCNIRAIPLTDSMQVRLRAKISRVSDRPRNPENAAIGPELEYIRQSKALLAQTGKVTPQLVDQGDHITGYYPILTNDMCLQCHGTAGDQLLPSTLERIEQLYPADLATGYSSDQLRGIWVVEMQKETGSE